MKRELAISFFVIILFALARISLDDDLNFRVKQKIFLQEKLSKLENVEVLLLGDSRVMNGVDPTYFGPNALNFAFTSNSYTKSYLDYLQNNKSKKLKKVYIGISVQSLTDFYYDHSFADTVNKKQHEVLLYLDHLMMKPIDLWNLKKIFNKTKSTMFTNGYMSLGDSVGPAVAVQSYKENYRDHKFKKHYIENLLTFSSYMEQNGVKIIYVLTPSKANKDDFNKDVSGIDKAELLSHFKKIYEYPEADKLEFVDGDHLTKSSSIAFSKWLASI